MTTYGILIFITVCSLATMTFTTPGCRCVGFKLKAALFLSSLGPSILIFTDPGAAANLRIVLDDMTVNNVSSLYLTACWCVLIAPYSKQVQMQRAKIAAEAEKIEKQRKKD